MQLQPSVLLLDDDDDLRPALEELITRCCHCRVIAHASYQAMAAASLAVLHTQVALLDVHLGCGKPSGVDAFEWLSKHTYQGKVMFLTGHAKSHPLVSQAMKVGRAVVLSKPVPAEQLVKAICEALHAG